LLFDESETKLIYIRDDKEIRPSFVRIVMFVGFLIRFSQCLSAAMLIHDILDSETETQLTMFMLIVEVCVALGILFYPVGGTASTSRWVWFLHAFVMSIGSMIAISSCFDASRFYPESITSSIAYALFSLLAEVPFHLVARMSDKTYVQKKLDAPPVVYRYEIVQEWATTLAVAMYAWIPPITLQVIAIVYLVLLVAMAFTATCGFLQINHANMPLHRAYDLAATTVSSSTNQTKPEKPADPLLEDGDEDLGSSDDPSNADQLKSLDQFVPSTIVPESMPDAAPPAPAPAPAPALQSMKEPTPPTETVPVKPPVLSPIPPPIPSTEMTHLSLAT